jgi:hypothetical protein
MGTPGEEESTVYAAGTASDTPARDGTERFATRRICAARSVIHSSER